MTATMEVSEDGWDGPQVAALGRAQCVGHEQGRSLPLLPPACCCSDMWVRLF